MKKLILVTLALVLTGCAADRVLVRDCKELANGYSDCEKVE